jgi:hypothetical protein
MRARVIYSLTGQEPAEHPQKVMRALERECGFKVLASVP